MDLHLKVFLLQFLYLQKHSFSNFQPFLQNHFLQKSQIEQFSFLRNHIFPKKYLQWLVQYTTRLESPKIQLPHLKPAHQCLQFQDENHDLPSQYYFCSPYSSNLNLLLYRLPLAEFRKFQLPLLLLFFQQLFLSPHWLKNMRLILDSLKFLLQNHFLFMLAINN